MLKERHIEAVREWVLSLEDVEETTPFGPETLVYKTAGRMFLLLPLDEEDLRFNVKCDPEEAIQLREQYPHSVLPGYHMNKKHWNTIVCNPELTLTQIAQFILYSYHLIRGMKPLRKKA
ncbi:MAG: MmcQ/YjbR family DNA-binding protein [Chitinophagaceae bacterium]|nr:MmcQ/YjbR family DNA-binding protein [Chitinophagaceae bacterium]